MSHSPAATGPLVQGILKQRIGIEHPDPGKRSGPRLFDEADFDRVAFDLYGARADAAHPGDFDVDRFARRQRAIACQVAAFVPDPSGLRQNRFRARFADEGQQAQRTLIGLPRPIEKTYPAGSARLAHFR